MAGTQGRSEAAAMLPSLQESLDGDEKELESSEDGGSAEERRLDPPPSSHYCLYSYRGSRCSARRPLWPRPGPAAQPRSPLRVPQLGVSQTQSSPLPAKVSGPQGPPRLTPYFPAPNPGPLRLVLPCLSAVSLTSSQPLPVTSAFCLAQCLARSIKSIPIPLSFLSLSPRFPPSPPLFPTPTFWLPSVLAASFPSSRADFLGLFWPCKVFLFLFGLLVGSWFPPQWKCRVLLGPPGNSL